MTLNPSAVVRDFAIESGATDDKRGVRIQPILGGPRRYSVPAHISLKTLGAYVGLYDVSGKFTATLSGGSTPPYVSALDLPHSRGWREVAVPFRANATSRALTVDFTLDANFPSTYHWIMLETATLQA